MNHRFATIVIPLAVDGAFHYGIPQDLSAKIQVGMRAVVSFGAKRFYTGIVTGISQDCPTSIKDIKEVLLLPDERPIVSLSDIAFWNWLATYYMCTLGEVLRAALPAALLPESRTEVIYNEEFVEEIALNDLELQIISILTSEKKASLSLDAIQKKLNRPAISAFTHLISYGAIKLKEDISSRIKKLPKERVVRIAAPFNESDSSLHSLLNDLKRAPRQVELIEKIMEHIFLKELDLNSYLSVDLICNQNTSLRGAMNALLKKGVLEDLYRTPQPEIEKTHIYQPLQPYTDNKDIAPITGLCSVLYKQNIEEKEEIIIDLIHRELSCGKQVLCITPEANRPYSDNDLIGKLKQKFHSYLRVYNSRLSEGKKLSLWQELIQTEAPLILVGARSSLFLPLNNPGLIIVDQDQDYGMKQQDPAPRYHTRDAAICLAQIKGAHALIASETPSAETLYNLNTDKWKSIVPYIPERVEMPPIEVIDLDKLYRQKRLQSDNLVSPQLEQEIKEALDRHERILLIQNRRGYSPYIKCKSCNTRISCPHCSVSLTYHKGTNLMMCHYCGYTMSVPEICPQCHNPEHTLTPFDFGSERVEEEISQLFPKAKVVRIDADILQSKKKMEDIMFQIDMGEVDILVGTQIIAGMPIWDNISLIGVMRLDNILAFPDFRAHERAYQLLYQLALRTHRQAKTGGVKAKIVLQTKDPQHPFIDELKSGDYNEFIMGQLEERNLCEFPPFTRMTTIIIKCKDKMITHRTAGLMTNMLRSYIPQVTIDMRVPSIERVELMYIREIVVRRKANQYGEERAAFGRVIQEIKLRYPDSKRCRIYFDVDPL